MSLVAHHAAQRQAGRRSDPRAPAPPLRHRARRHIAPDRRSHRPARRSSRRPSRAAAASASMPGDRIDRHRDRDRRAPAPPRARTCRRSRSRWRSADRRTESATTSASDTVAQVRPTHDPAASWRRAISGVLCALKCGRSRHGPPAKNAAMRAMLRSSAATSTISAGVGNVDGALDAAPHPRLCAPA